MAESSLTAESSPASQSTDSPSPTAAVDVATTADAQSRRGEPRLKLPAMYTLVRVRLPADEHYRWTGHIYDISLSGMRFELDESLAAGTQVEARVMLPGHRHTLFRVLGRIVRHHDDHPTIAPVRMAMTFERFHNHIDHYRLANYLATAGLKRSGATPRRATPAHPIPRVRRPAA